MLPPREQELKNGQYDDSHHLLEIKMLPHSLILFRNLLQREENADIKEYVSKGNSFEECLARTATFLSIVVDGDYDVGPLCEVFINAINTRKLVGNQPHLSDVRLVNAEIVETEGDVTLQRVEEAVEEAAPPPAPKLILDS
jgi:hypothetical protein